MVPGSESRHPWYWGQSRGAGACALGVKWYRVLLALGVKWCRGQSRGAGARIWHRGQSRNGQSRDRDEYSNSRNAKRTSPQVLSIFHRSVLSLTWSKLLRCGTVLCGFAITPSLAPAQVNPPDPATIKISPTLTGAQIYSMTCAACHQATGAGLLAQYPPLAPSDFVTGNEQRLIHIVLRGLTGEVEVEGEMFKGEMPGWAPALSDAQVALVLTYIRKSFGNTAPLVTADKVAAIRTATGLRKKPYTAAEIAKLPAK